MNRSFLLKACALVVSLAGTAGGLRAQGNTADIKRAAQETSSAVLAGNYDVVATYTHPRIVGVFGGAARMVEFLKKSDASNREKGIALQDSQVGEPQAITRVGEWYVSVVPQMVTMKVPAGRIRSESFLLAISEDNGAHWSFIDLSVDRKKLLSVFPELTKAELPPKKSRFF